MAGARQCKCTGVMPTRLVVYLIQARQDSIDIDWDAVDLGTFTGTTATPSKGMPLAARIAFAATVLAVLLLLSTAVFTLFD